MREAARTATGSDLDTIVTLARAMIDELTPTRGGALWARHAGPRGPLDAHYAAWLGVADRALFVGTIDDAVVGFATVRVEPLHDGSPLAVIDELFVEPTARAVGVGEAMAGAAVSWAESAGCIGVDVGALPGNRAAKNFFETHGFVARSIIMHRPIERGA